MTDNEIEGLIYEAFRQSGALIPRTVAEVEQAEKEMEGIDIELPESLRDPEAVWNRIQAGRQNNG
jgi:hypothetical protein